MGHGDGGDETAAAGDLAADLGLVADSAGGCGLTAGGPSAAAPLAGGSPRLAWLLLFALVDGALFHGLLAEGLERTGAGLGSVLIYSHPLLDALLDP